MTAKRDLKRRVRQRQARTGEAYVTARRHVVGTRAAPADGDADADPETGTDTDVETDAATTGEAVDPAASPDPTAAPEAAVTTATAATAEATPDPGATAAIAAPDPGPRGRGAMSVVELLDVTDQARRVGLVCRVAMFPALAARIEPTSVLTRLRDLLVETLGDPQFQLLSQVALTGTCPPLPPRAMLSYERVERFLRRARAGLGGVSDDGMTLAFHVAGPEGLVPVGCAVHWPGGSLVLSGIDDLMQEVAGLRDWLTEARGRPGRRVTDLLAIRATPVAVGAAPTLFVIHNGRRYPITRDEFLIGRHAGDVHLVIKDGMVSRRHAAVIRRNGNHYLKDLGSANGIQYKGMRIDNKRIDEGDVFRLGDHELRFTYRDDDEK